MAIGLRESGVLALIFSLFIYFYMKNEIEKVTLKNVLHGLLKEEASVNATGNLKAAVGFGSCMDLFVDGIRLLEKLDLVPPTTPRHHDVFNTKEELAESFAFFLQEGAASERFTEPDLFQEVLKAARNLPGAYWNPGGNAPVISKRLSMEGVEEILIGSNAGRDYRALFPDNMIFLGESDHKDDIHLILEFKVGDKWGNFTAPRANRWIIHSDDNNPKLTSLEEFKTRLVSFKPDLVVVSALQMLDNYPFKDGERDKRMQVLKDLLQSLTMHSHFEMASFSEKVMMESILKYVLPYVTSLGMNEQELPNLVSMLKYGDIITISNANPRTAVVLDSMRELYNLMKDKSVRGLERIHVHTLAFQAILTKRGTRWKNTRPAAAKASLAANRYICNNKNINLKYAKLLMDDSFAISTKASSKRIKFLPEKPVSCWDEDDFEFCVAPVLVCTNIYRTAGGGDNVSPSGLVLQL